MHELRVSGGADGDGGGVGAAGMSGSCCGSGWEVVPPSMLAWME